MTKKNISIIGSGNIGSDLLVKFIKNNKFNVHSFIGQNKNSKGLSFCRSKFPEVQVSSESIEFIKRHHKEIDILVDCTNAKQHMVFNEIYKLYKFKVIDMTPSNIGLLTIPNLIDFNQIKDNNNFNLISCGGQTSIPLAHKLSKEINNIDYLEVVSSISSKSAGPATRLNLDEYIETTEFALSSYTGIDIKSIKVILILNPAIPEIDMQTSIYFKTKKQINIKSVSDSLDATITEVNSYVPGYRKSIPLTMVGDRYLFSVKVSGSGDYLPSYAGNLDIINCACVSLSEKLII